jgi:multiple sugar transport system substrate-binding protein
MKRKLSILLILCLVMTMFAACGGGGEEESASTEPAKLVVAARGGSHVDVLNAVKADFEAENNCTIEILGLEATDLKQKVSLDSQNKVGAYDLAMADDPWMPEYCEAGIFANLTELGYKADSDFVKASLDIGKYPYAEGDIYALPFAGNVQLLFYNKQVLDDAGMTVPESWEDVLKIAKAVNGKDGKVGYVIRGQQGNPIVTDYLPILWAYGGDVFDKSGNLTIDTKEAKEALKLYMELLKNGANYEKNDIVAAVSGGKAAAALGWPSWFISGETASADYAAIPSKATPTSAPHPTGMIGNWMMGVTANSGNSELAMKFLEYVTSADVQKKAAEFGGVPTRTSVFNDSELLAKYPYFATILTCTENSVVRPRLVEWTDIETAYGTELSSAISGTKSVDQALADARTAIEAIIK